MNRIKIAVLAGVLGAFSAVSIAFAWSNPILTPKCAPNSNEFAFDITLQPEADQLIDLSYDSGFATIIRTQDFVTDGTHSFTTPVDPATDLYARYQSDNNAKTSVAIDKNLCNPRSGGSNSSSGFVKFRTKKPKTKPVATSTPPIATSTPVSTPTFVKLNEIPVTGYWGE